MQSHLSVSRVAVYVFIALAVFLSGSIGHAEGLTPVTKASSPITIDGRTGDWATVPSIRLTAQSTSAASNRLSATLRLAWNEESLYLLVEASDPAISASDDLSRDFAGSDFVRLYVSKSQEARKGPFDQNDFVIIATPTSLFQKPLKTIYGYGGYEHLDFDLTKVRVGVRPTVPGYAMEMAVPWSELGLTPKTGQRLGIQVVVADSGGTSPRSLAMLVPVPVSELTTARVFTPAALE